MATKKKSKRLAPATPLAELGEILGHFPNRVQERPRSGGEWKSKLDRVFNLERFNYRLGPEPAAQLRGNNVVFMSKEGRSREFSKAAAMSAFKLAHAVMRSGVRTHWGYVGHTMSASTKTELKVGCQTFDWPSILAFGREQGWDKDKKKKVTKKGKKK